MSKKQREEEKKEALDLLRKLLRPGDTVYTVIRSVSRSGMSRTLDAYAFVPDRKNGPRAVVKLYLSGLLATLTGHRRKNGSIVVGGCGFDAGFEVVSDAARVLFPNEERPCYSLRHEWIG